MRLGELAGAATTLARTYGGRGLVERGTFLARRSLGRFRGAPSSVPAAVSTAAIPPLWPLRADAERVRAATDPVAARRRADRVAAGEHHAYSVDWRPLPARAADWSRHPLTGHDYGRDTPWHRIPWYLPTAGDVKDVFEPARFGWSYDLVRGWLVTRDPRHAERFWQLLDSFLEGAAPFRGIQWACGQETAIRAIALLWAEAALADAPSSTPQALARLRCALAWSAERIDDAIDYALSQRNNHAISEATGLIAIGARLAGAHPHAERWIRRGRRLLERIVRDQFEEDGWYIQHSFTYARVALDQLTIAQRVLAWRGTPLSAAARMRIAAAIELLAELIDAGTGDLPNHGANDGARVLPLSLGGYRDFRPTLTAAAVTFGVPLPGDVPADGETLAWLAGDGVLRSAPRPVPRVRTGPSGWVHAVADGARVFTRAARYRSRPGHVDPLHADIWIEERPIAVDAGTFRYHAPAPWGNALADADVHNALTIEGHPMARRVGRFLWLRWPEARVLRAELGQDGVIRIDLEQESWRAEGIRHRRTIELAARSVIVHDLLETPPTLAPEAVLHWLLRARSESVRIDASSEASLEETVAAEGSVTGWISDHYATRHPGISLRARARPIDGRLMFTTRFGDATREPATPDECETSSGLTTMAGPDGRGAGA